MLMYNQQEVIIMSVGTNIRLRRMELGMTQQELASALGYTSRSTIAKIESGENDISYAKLKKVAEVLYTDVNRLTGENAASFEEPETDFLNVSDSGTRNVCVILAGGKSFRNEQNIPNQFINVRGKPVIIYSLEIYQNHPAIEAIYVVCLKGWENMLLSYAREYGITKLKGIVAPGETGILSARAAIEHIRPLYSAGDVVIIQESTRPFVKAELISTVLSEAASSGTAVTSEPMSDYNQFYDTGKVIVNLDRSRVIAAQAPEAYTLETICMLFNEAKKQQLPMTESCCYMMLHALKKKINFIPGGRNNIKIVRQEDLLLFEGLLNG